MVDIDNTLYSNEVYYRLQIELLVNRFADWMGMSVQKAWDLLETEKKRYTSDNDGRQTSTGNIMQTLGVSLDENARWRDQLFKPEEHLTADGGTIAAVKELVSMCSIAAVTNNTVNIGRRTLAALDLDGLISVIIGLDTCFVSKPAREPFETALGMLEVSPLKAVSIGDRYDVDLEVPLSMGMGGILIDGLSDLYELPEILRSG